MKKYSIVALIIVALAAVASAVLWNNQPAPQNTESWLARELKLTPAQQTQIASMGKDFSGKCDAYCDAMCEARFALGEELGHAQGVTPKVEELLSKMQTAQAASERETLQHLFRIKSILTLEQQARYIEIITGKLCGNCPRHLHQADAHPAEHHQ